MELFEQFSNVFVEAFSWKLSSDLAYISPLAGAVIQSDLQVSNSNEVEPGAGLVLLKSERREFALEKRSTEIFVSKKAWPRFSCSGQLITYLWNQSLSLNPL